MAKAKKLITSIVLAFILVLSSLVLFACGNSVTSDDSFALIGETLNTYKENTKLFGTGRIYDVQTNFYLARFQSKNADGNMVSDSNNFIAFTALGLNYIEDNYTRLENLDVDYDYSSLNNQVEKMNQAYDDLCIEFSNFLNVESSADYNIYNGYFARYKQSTKFFIEEIYQTAEQLGSFLVQTYGDGIGTSAMTSETFNDYVDYNEFLIGRDYKNFFITSSQGKTFNQSLYNTVQTQFETYTEKLFSTPIKSLTTEVATNVKELFEAVNTNRKNVTKALEEISLYEFYSSYNGSLIAYEKNKEDATLYYNNIDSYFNSDGVLVKLYNYLLSL